MSSFMTDEVHIPEEEQNPQDDLPEIEAEKPAAAFVFADDEEDEEPIELPTPATVEAIELPAPEAEEVKAALPLSALESRISALGR